MIPSYSFESPAAFMVDFGIPATRQSNGETKLVIFDEPERDILGGRVMSVEYAITFKSTDFVGMTINELLSIGGVIYKVQTDPDLMDDGAFSRARLQQGA